MVEYDNEALNFKRKCELLHVPRGSMYYKSETRNNDEDIINVLREIYREIPFYGYRRMTIALKEKGLLINHKKTLRLMRKAGIQAIYSRKKTTIKNPAHKVFPYLLSGMKIERPNQVWQVDITYIKITGGFVYLVCLIDIFSRKVMGWSLSNCLDTTSCLEALNNSLKEGVPNIINSDQGCQFTSDVWVKTLRENEIKISMDGKGRWADNIYIERLWRTIKYEMIYLYSFDSVEQVRSALDFYLHFYNSKRYHSQLNYHTPNVIFDKKCIPTKQELLQTFTQQKNYSERSDHVLTFS